MERNSERRTERRLRYHWPVWFAEDYEQGDLSQGQMADISSRAAAFTCYAHEQCPCPGEYVTTRFGVPRYALDDSFDIADFLRKGRVHRVDAVNGYIRRVVVRFTEPLPFRPGEQASDLVAPVEEPQRDLVLA